MLQCNCAQIPQYGKEKKYCQHCINNMCVSCHRVLPYGEKRHKIFTIVETNIFNCHKCYNLAWDYILRED